MKEPRVLPPGRRRGSSSTGGLSLPLLSPFQAAVPSAVSSSSLHLRSLGPPLAAASGLVLLLFCLFASTSSSRSSRGFGSGSERSAPWSLPGSNEAAAAARASRRFRLPGVGVGGIVGGGASSSSAAALRLRGSDSSSGSVDSLPLPPPRPTLSPEDEDAFEADMISMLAGGEEGGEEEGEGEEKKKNAGGGGASTTTTATAATTASSSSSAAAAVAAAAASDSAKSSGIGGSSSSSPSLAGVTVKKESSSSDLSSPLRLFAGGDADDAKAAATTASSSSSSAPGNNSTLLPPDFDWRLYLAYNPDLRASGVSDAASAAAHFIARGRQEGRPAARLRVALRYTACTGLINQHYSHIAALSLASVLGTEVVLPPAAQRDSFAHYFSTFADRNEVSWTAAPLETLLDVQGLIETWKKQGPGGGGGGLTLRPAPSTAPFPDLTSPGTAYPAYAFLYLADPAPDPPTVVKVSDVYLKNLDMAALVEKVRAAAVGKAVALRRAQLAAAASAPGSPPAAAPLPPLPLITVDLPCTFFMLRTSDSLEVVTGVARTLKFAPLLVELADKVSRGVAQAAAAEAAAAEAVARVSALSSTSTSASSSSASSATAASPPVFIQATTTFSDSASSSSSSSSSSNATAAIAKTLPFNGVHLRIETDARDWEEILGGRAALWGGYLAAARAARFDSATPLYVASGLLTYGASAEMDKVAAEIKKEGLASSIHYKEQHLTSADLAALNSEQKAAVDFLVLQRSRSFVGLGSSTFSFYLREHRALEGIPRSSTVLVDASKIGTDDLFASAGVVV